MGCLLPWAFKCRPFPLHGTVFWTNPQLRHSGRSKRRMESKEQRKVENLVHTAQSTPLPGRMCMIRRVPLLVAFTSTVGDNQKHCPEKGLKCGGSE